jgi:hypothetical protein
MSVWEHGHLYKEREREREKEREKWREVLKLCTILSFVQNVMLP